MSPTAPQRTVTISFIGTEADLQLGYSYWSPISGQSFLNAPVCDLSINRPTYCLFMLDYESALKGWTIIGIESHGVSATIASTLGAYGLSIATFDPYQTSSDRYQFSIHYKNTVTGVEKKFDPQEGNIPR